MKIICLATDQDKIEVALIKAIDQSRFIANIERVGKNLKVFDVRLKKKKAYCGNHPSMCERPHLGPHTKRIYLEGADWVEFNDLINNVLDSLSISANVSTVQCVLRKGKLRRVVYSPVRKFNILQWVRDEYGEGAYVDYCGQIAPKSMFPVGTPGIYGEYSCVG